AEMNQLAKASLMKDTKFINAHGLERQDAFGISTAADAARLTVVALRRNAINFIVRQKTREVKIVGISGVRTYTLKNRNQLVIEGVATGAKTGSTARAGECLAASSDREPLVRESADGNKSVIPRR